jgi:hypothetical protein
MTFKTKRSKTVQATPPTESELDRLERATIRRWQFTQHDHDLLIETHAAVQNLTKYLLDNGQPGELTKIKNRLGWLEKVAYGGVGIGTVIGGLIKIGLINIH